MKHLFAIVGIGLGIGTVASVLRTGDDIPDKQAASIPQKVRNDVQISLSDPLIPPK